jgi:autotransporter-associated beta strand protein
MNNTGTITNSITVQAGSSGNTLTITGGSGSPTTQILGGTLALNNNLTVTPIASIAMTFSNVVSGAGSLTKNGTTLILSGPNTFTGKTRINAGTLSVGSLNRVSGGTASSNLGAPVTVDNGTISIGTVGTAATLSYTGAGETTDRVIDLAGTTGGATINQSGTGLLKFTGNLTATGEGAKTLTLQGSTDGAGEVAGNIPNNTVANLTRVTKAGTGLWTLSGANSFSGATAIQNGILRVSSLNRVTGGTASSSLGAPALANATISLGYNSTTGQLTYAGSGETTDRVINLAGTTGGGTLEAAGTGPLVFTSAFTATGTGSKTLTLQGSSTATNTIAASIVNKDANNRTRLTKDGSGLWLLNGTTTYSGPTTVANGTLAINGRILSPVTVQNGGVLTGAGTILTNNVTALTVGGILDPGRVGGIGALSVTGSVVFAEGRFHVDATGASADRLNVSGSVASSGGTVPVRATITNPGLTKSWKILSASGGITAEFASAGIGYTVAKANADTELWLLKNPEGTVMLVR